MGLGLHGGGVATAKWLIKHGATVTATDKRSADILGPSIKALQGVRVRYVFGAHNNDDFRTHDMIIANPAVPAESPYLAIAKKAKKTIVNDASLFFTHSDNPAIAVTGTRGKTTTTLWIAELLKKKYPKVRPSGNTPDNALLKEFDRVQGKDIPVVAELSSWQLEYLPQVPRAPHVAVITNIYPDHLNRYGGSIERYADAKAGIFAHQTEDDFLILNRDNKWGRYFAAKPHRAQIIWTSTKPLPRSVGNGVFVCDDHAYLLVDGEEKKIVSITRFAKERGAHNLANLLAACAAALFFEPALVVTEKDILRLPGPPMRQEVIYRKGRLTVVNDSCATSPDGTIAALRRFFDETPPEAKLREGHLPKLSFGGRSRRIILITGGTDKELDPKELAKEIERTVKKDDLILLDGSATKKLASCLKRKELLVLDTLKECVDAAFVRVWTPRTALKDTKGRSLERETIILFSPGAASFEKFLHEFDRGEKFNRLATKGIAK